MTTRTAFRSLAIGLVLTASTTIDARAGTPPSLKGLSPRGVQRGREARIELRGPGIGRASPELLAELPGTIGPIEVADSDRVVVPINVPADAPIGLYPIRVRTGDGVTAALLLAVGDLPEAAEVEPNDTPGVATALTLPVVVNGSTNGTDVDCAKFAAKKGQPVVIEVEARRLGSGLDPVLAVYDAAGRLLAADADAASLAGGDRRLVFDPPADGEYVAALSDARYSGGGDAFYRLRIGPFAVAEAIFPLGWRRGESLPLQFLGAGLPAPVTATIVTPADPGVSWVPVAPPFAGPSVGVPFRLALDDRPQAIEPDGSGPHPMAVGTAMNGRIAAPGEVDRYKLAAAPGQSLAIELAGARHGSKLDAVVKVTRPDGAMIAESGETGGPEPSLAVTVPGDLAEVIVTVQDLLGRSGPAHGYRLSATPTTGDFQLVVDANAVTVPVGAAAIVPVRAIRRGYDGPIQLSVPADLAGVAAADGLIPQGAAAGNLVLTGTPGTAARLLPLEIWGSGGPAAQPIRRKARLASDGTPLPPRRPGELVAAIGSAPTVTLAADGVAGPVVLVHGLDGSIKVKATRPEGHKEPIAVTTAGMPPGVGGGQATINGDQSETTLSFNVDSLTPLVRPTLIVTGKTKGADGREETVVLPPIRARVVRPYELEILTPALTLTPGQKATIVGVIRRTAPFAQAVKVGVPISLPAGLTVTEATLAPDGALVQLELAATADAAPATLDLPVRASTEMPGRKSTKDYVIPDVNVKVTIAPAPATPVAAAAPTP